MKKFRFYSSAIFLANILLVAVLSGCSHKNKQSEYITEFVSGTDTIAVLCDCNIDATKCHASYGERDTVKNIDRIFFTNSFRKDTVFIHDTIYTSKHYDNVGTVIIDQR